MEIVAGGIPIGFDDIGQGRVAVFLHGMPASRRQMVHYFEPIFAERPGWRRIYPDLPGMGTTPASDDISNQDAMLDVVGEFVEKVAEGEPVVLVGASYGGYLALGYNFRWGSRLAGLMLTEPMVKTRPNRQVPEHTILVEDRAVLAELEPDEEFWTQVAVIQSSENLEDFRTAIKPGFSLADQEFLARLAERAEFSFDLQTASPMTAPALIVAGRQDSVTGYRDVLEILELFPRATVAILDRAGHAVSSEQRTLFRMLTHEFFDRVEESSHGSGS
jgi:pimeloyl-ACP methyl ester carboxylesterase